MFWEQLGKAVSLFNKVGSSYPKKPLNPYERCYSETVLDPNPEQIVVFLNSWGRMRKSFNVNKISKTIDESKTILEQLNEYKIETVELPYLKDDILKIFQLILNSTDSPVAATKVLHVLVPNLFVMWDTTIRAAYGCGIYENLVATTWKETYYIFLTRVQRTIRKAINSYSKDSLIDFMNFMDASEKLKRELYIDGQKTLAKIIDEYNFMKFTRGSEELWKSDH